MILPLAAENFEFKKKQKNSYESDTVPRRLNLDDSSRALGWPRGKCVFHFMGSAESSRTTRQQALGSSDGHMKNENALRISGTPAICQALPKHDASRIQLWLVEPNFGVSAHLRQWAITKDDGQGCN